MGFQYTKHERVFLKEVGLSEAWLHERILADPSILGLGLLDVTAKEKVQYGAGRLDMQLADTENGVRYEVEIMLGATDPSHIIRCIEYWDIERRRYPAYDHLAVLVAEEVTARFLNVISLFAGSIPLIAIQLNALRLGDQILLDFVKVLDQRDLRGEDPPIGGEDEVDRAYWDARVGAGNMAVCDRLLAIAKDVPGTSLELKYKKAHVGICEHGSFFNYVALFPKKSFVACRTAVSNPDQWIERGNSAGIEIEKKSGNRVLTRPTSEELRQHEDFYREWIHQAIREQIS